MSNIPRIVYLRGIFYCFQPPHLPETLKALYHIIYDAHKIRYGHEQLLIRAITGCFTPLNSSSFLWLMPRYLRALISSPINNLLSNAAAYQNTVSENLMLQFLRDRTEDEKMLAVNLIKLLFSYLGENKNRVKSS